jgi:hypothetical protein
METTYTWTDIDEVATLMALRNRGEPAGSAKLAAAFFFPAIRRANRHDLRRLKAILEGRPARATAPGPIRQR